MTEATTTLTRAESRKVDSQALGGNLDLIGRQRIRLGAGLRIPAHDGPIELLELSLQSSCNRSRLARLCKTHRLAWLATQHVEPPVYWDALG